MKNSLSGSLINELEVISIAFEERIKATNRLQELKQRETKCIKTITVKGDCVITYYKKQK